MDAEGNDEHDGVAGAGPGTARSGNPAKAGDTVSRAGLTIFAG